MTPRSLFRAVAVAEAITWTLLITGLVLRATVGLDLAVTIGGGIHGFVFLTYAATAVLVAINQRWSFGVTALAVVVAIVPYATIPFEIWAARTGRLEGAWRRDPADDRHWLDALVRWAIGRPVLLAVVAAVAVVAVFVILLIVGPPVPHSA